MLSEIYAVFVIIVVLRASVKKNLKTNHGWADKVNATFAGLNAQVLQ
jgi:hypothetical protein